MDLVYIFSNGFRAYNLLLQIIITQARLQCQSIDSQQSLLGYIRRTITDVQSQKAVTPCVKSKQILSFRLRGEQYLLFDLTTVISTVSVDKPR